MKILFIGNSFSHDANRYLYSLCNTAGLDVELLNLWIGGCSLERHAACAKENKRDYMVQYNGIEYRDYHATLDEGLAFRDWDYISIQQVSGCSGRYDTFRPYADVLVGRIRELCPRAKILVHMTWAYEWGSDHHDFPRYDCSPLVMTERLTDAYTRLAEDIGAYAIIPSGRVIAKLKAMPEFDVREGGVSLHRDGFHLSEEYGRYAAAGAWYQWMGLGDIRDNPFIPDGGGEIDAKLLGLVKQTVADLVEPNKGNSPA